MDWAQQAMYIIGTLITMIVSFVAFIQGLRIIHEQEDENWREEWKQRIETIGKPTQSISG